MSAPTSLTDLAARVEAAEGPDRDIDLVMFNLRPSMFPYRFMRDVYSKNPEPKLLATYILPESMDGQDVLHLAQSDPLSVVPVPAYTASVDAVLALIAEKLPGEEEQLLNDAIERIGEVGFRGRWAYHLPLFLAAALLRDLDQGTPDADA